MTVIAIATEIWGTGTTGHVQSLGTGDSGRIGLQKLATELSNKTRGHPRRRPEFGILL